MEESVFKKIHDWLGEPAPLEYGLIAALIAVAIIGGTTAFSDSAVEIAATETPVKETN